MFRPPYSADAVVDNDWYLWNNRYFSLNIEKLLKINMADEKITNHSFQINNWTFFCIDQSVPSHGAWSWTVSMMVMITMIITMIVVVTYGTASRRLGCKKGRSGKFFLRSLTDGRAVQELILAQLTRLVHPRGSFIETNKHKFLLPRPRQRSSPAAD